MICELCFHHCDLSEGQTGFCRARACRDGTIVPLNYGKLTSLVLDPIEKKPLRQFHPGSMVLSVGSFGCNLRCPTKRWSCAIRQYRSGLHLQRAADRL